MLRTTLHPDRAYRQSEIPTFFGETVQFPGQQGEAGLSYQGHFPTAATDVAKVYALPGVVVLSLFVDPVVGQVELAVQVPEDPSSQNPRGRLRALSIAGAPQGVGGPAEQGREIVRSPLDLPSRALQPPAKTEPGRRDVERRDEPSLEVPDRRRRTDQAELELLDYQRITLLPREGDALL